MKDKKVLIVKNVHRESPGLIRTVLEESHVPFRVFSPYFHSDKFPDPSVYEAIIVLGGPQSANDKSMKKELEFIARIRELKIPYFGVCLGMQLAVKDDGGEVYNAPFKEIGCRDNLGGYYQVELTKEGKSDQILAGINNPFKVFQLHGETVRLREDARLLGRGYGQYQTENQVIKFGKNAYGIQGHFELTESMLERWLQQDRDLKSLDESVREALRRDYDTIKSEYQATGRIIFHNFLKIAGII